MTEEEPFHPPEATPGPEPAEDEPILVAPPSSIPPPPPPPRRRQPTLVPWVFALAFVVLGWAVMFLWLHPASTVRTSEEASRIDALDHRVQALDTETRQLAARPLAQPQALAVVQAQLAALAARKPATPDLTGLEGRIAALERQKPAPAVDLAPLRHDLAAVQQQVAALGPLRNQTDQLGQRLDHLAHGQQALADAVKTLTAGQKNADSGLVGRIDDLGKAVDGLHADVAQLDAGLAQATAAARVQAALTALQAGRPLGTIPGAPPAVVRFATHPPPTLAALRGAFPAVARAALASSRPADQNQRFLDRVWNRAQDLVTVRQGDRVLVGDPASGVIARAGDAVDAGNVAGAVDALSTLTGPAAAAVADWLGSARALLAARAALLGMTGQAEGPR